MKRTLFAVLFLSGLALGQAARIGTGQPVESSVLLPGFPGQNFVVLVPFAQVTVCPKPANAVPCTNKAPTFTDNTSGTACDSSVQLTLDGSNTCVSTSDAKGQWGAWVLPGDYQYTVCVNGACSGPYDVTAAVSGSSGTSSNVVTGSGTAGIVPLWTSNGLPGVQGNSDIQNVPGVSLLFNVPFSGPGAYTMTSSCPISNPSPPSVAFTELAIFSDCRPYWAVNGAAFSASVLKTDLLVSSLTTTANATDNVSITGMTASGHCQLQPTNANAATDYTSTYVSNKTVNQITVTHPVSSGRTFDITCTAY